MFDTRLLPLGRDHPLRRFWKSARGFWHGPTARLAWGLISLLIVITVLQLLVQYRLNLWNRDFFNALEFRNGSEIWHQTHLLVLFAAISIGLAVTAVWGRVTFQRLPGQRRRRHSTAAATSWWYQPSAFSNLPKVCWRLAPLLKFFWMVSPMPRSSTSALANRSTLAFQ